MGEWTVRRRTGSTHAKVWSVDLPSWAELPPLGIVTTYIRPDGPTAGDVSRRAAWQLYLSREPPMRGLLGAEFTPIPGRPELMISAHTTGEAMPGPANYRYNDKLERGLPLYFGGAVLAGASLEAASLGPGDLTFRWGATHPVDTSWADVRNLTVGVVRLLKQPEISEASAEAVLEGLNDPAPVERDRSG